MDALSRDLRRLSTEIDDIGSALRREQWRLDGMVQAAFTDELSRSRKKLMETGKRSEAAACSILRSAEQFADCERTERRRFEESMRVIPAPMRTLLPRKELTSHENQPFAPKNVHFVRMTVREENRHV